MNLHEVKPAIPPEVTVVLDYLTKRFSPTYSFKYENGQLMERSNVNSGGWYEGNLDFWTRELRNDGLLP